MVIRPSRNCSGVDPAEHPPDPVCRPSYYSAVMLLAKEHSLRQYSACNQQGSSADDIRFHCQSAH